MPLTFEVEFEDGSKETLRLPVQVWFKSDKVVHLVKSDLEIVAVRLDPGRMLPDNKRTNNSWKAEQ